jgi:hypothetical protein
VHAELKRPSVTLMLLWQEYTSANSGALTYRYSQFTDLYRSYVVTTSQALIAATLFLRCKSFRLVRKIRR